MSHRQTDCMLQTDGEKTETPLLNNAQPWPKATGGESGLSVWWTVNATLCQPVYEAWTAY